MSGQRLTIAAPLAAVLIVVLLIWANSQAEVPAMHLTAKLQITIVNKEYASHNVLPTSTIGVPGGIMNASTYLSDGLNGRYPLYSENIGDHGGTILIHIESRVVRNYTLGDFFAVWGEPIGPNRTFTLSSNRTSPAQENQFFWDMCIINPVTNFRTPSFDWGSHVLKDGETVDLLFSTIGCS